MDRYNLYSSDECQLQDVKVIRLILMLIGKQLPRNSPRRLAKYTFPSVAVASAMRSSQRPYGEQSIPVASEHTYKLAREFLERAYKTNHPLLLFY